MRIAYLSHSTVPSRAANSVHVMKMGQALSSLGHEVLLTSLLRRGRLEPKITDIYRYYDVEPTFEMVDIPWLPIAGRRFLAGYMSAIEAASMQADLVYGRFLHGCCLSTLLGFPTGWEAHMPLADDNLESRMTFKSMITSRNFVGLVVISNALRDRYLRDFPQLEGRVIVAHDAADPVRLAMPAQPSSWPKAELHVGYVGHFYPGKGMERISELAVSCPWAHFHLVGGTDKDLRYWQRRLDGLTNVTLYGFVSQRQAQRLRCHCDVLLAPYQRTVRVFQGNDLDASQWMSPLKLFEYMAAGKAIIASDLPVLREILTDNQNALLCPPEESEAWQSTLDKLRRNKELRVQLGTTARTLFEQEHTWLHRARFVVNALLGRLDDIRSDKTRLVPSS